MLSGCGCCCFDLVVSVLAVNAVGLLVVKLFIFRFEGGFFGLWCGIFVVFVVVVLVLLWWLSGLGLVLWVILVCLIYGFPVQVLPFGFDLVYVGLGVGLRFKLSVLGVFLWWLVS